MERPIFEEIKNYDEFETYYWYKEELAELCKQQGIAHVGHKKELMENIKAYFNGEIIKPKSKTSVKKQDIELSLDTKLYESGFAMRNEYRSFFAKELGLKTFKYSADMAAAIKKVRQEKNKEFTVRDLIDVYLGKSDYAKFDNSSCQWNQFIKDFCKDQRNDCFDNKLKVATLLWKKLKLSPKPKVYGYEFVVQNQKLVQPFFKEEK